ncbi:unnamed protein product [Coregonus sp. 'balchen']|nr:unnamed protein product [Coregonus sp. 'balchen']
MVVVNDLQTGKNPAKGLNNTTNLESPLSEGDSIQYLILLDLLLDLLPSFFNFTVLFWMIFAYDRVIFIYLAEGLWVYPLLRLVSTSGVLGLFLFNMTVVKMLFFWDRP